MNLEVVMSVASDLLAQQKFISSMLLLAVLLLLKKLVVTQMRKRSSKRGEDRRHQINTFKQLYNAAALIILLVIWSSEVQEFAFSIAAFTVAIVLATKEFIQCFLGFIYYLGARPFRVGEWIQLDGDIMGEVVEIDWAKVALLEVNSNTLEYTGKHLYVPNSRLVTQTVKNLNFLRRYSMHSFRLTFEPSENIALQIPAFIAIAQKHCAEFHDVADRYKNLIERHLDVEFISTEPVIQYETNQFAKSVLDISLFCPTGEAYAIQQRITLDILALLQQSPVLTRSDTVNLKPTLVDTQ